MEVNIPPKSDDPQRLIALNGVPKEFWLSALEINQMVNALKFLLGEAGSLYLGEHESLYKLELAHPDPAPGSYAQIVVADGPNQKAEWDNNLKKWIVTGDYDFPENSSNSEDSKVIFFNSGYQSGLNYKVSAAWTFPGLSFGTEANPVIKEITLDPADALNPRIDLIVLNSDGTITKKTGKAGANPSKPDIDPNNEVEATFILISAGANVPDGISTILIYNENTQAAGGEFNTTEDTEGARINLASVVDFTTGAKAIEGTKTKFYDTITFTPENPIQVSEISEISFDFKNKPAVGDRSIFFRFKGQDQNGNAKVKSLAPGVYDPASEAWQFVAMSLAKIDFPILTSVELVANGGKQDDFGFFMDNVRFTGGTKPVNNDYVRFEDLQSYALNDLSNLVSNLTEAQQNVIKQKLGITGGGTGGNYLPPAPYATMQAMYDAQANQVINQTYRVTNASGHSKVNAGRAWFEFIGTTNAAEEDYILKSEEESLNLDQQFAALQAQITANANNITAHNNRLNSLESIDNIIKVDTNITLGPEHIRKVLYITASVVITWPAGGIANFKCNAECNENGSADIIDEAATPGNDLSAPNGATIAANESAHLMNLAPIEPKLRISK